MLPLEMPQKSVYRASILKKNSNKEIVDLEKELKILGEMGLRIQRNLSLKKK